MKKLIFFLAFLIPSLAFAGNRAVLQNGSGNEVGTSSNPVYVTSTGGGFAGWTSDGATKTTTTYNVGIGTTVADLALTLGPGADISLINNGSITFGPQTPGTTSYYEKSNSDDNFTLFRSDSNSADSFVKFTQFSSGGNVGLFVQGNTGIGSTSPQAKLVVVAPGTDSTTQAFNVRDSAFTSKFLIDSAGNIGIGTTLTSGAALSIMNGSVGIGTWLPGTNIFQAGAGTTSSGTNFIVDSGGDLYCNSGSTCNIQSGAALSFVTSSNNQLGFNSGSGNQIFTVGNVGLTTATPGQKLDVNGNIRSGAGTVSAPAIVGRTGGNAAGIWYPAADTFAVSTSGSERMRIISNGNVGIGTTIPEFVFKVAGTTGFSGLSASGVGDTYVCLSTTNELRTGATCAASSQKIKENIKNLEHGLDWTKKLRPVQFNFKNGFYKGINSVGFIAEEVDKISPMLSIRNEKGEVYSVHYDTMTAVLVKAIQELQNRVEKLENKK